MHEKSGWIVWNFEYKSPNFGNEEIALSAMFPQFANVYQVTSSKKENQSFLKCDCLLWEMWYSMFTHFEDRQWNWSYNDKNTTLESVSRAFWSSRIKNKSKTHESYFYSADWWRYGCSNFWWESTQGEQSGNLSVSELVYTNCHSWKTCTLIYLT